VIFSKLSTFITITDIIADTFKFFTPLFYTFFRFFHLFFAFSKGFCFFAEKPNYFDRFFHGFSLFYLM